MAAARPAGRAGGHSGGHTARTPHSPRQAPRRPRPSAAPSAPSGPPGSSAAPSAGTTAATISAARHRPATTASSAARRRPPRPPMPRFRDDDAALRRLRPRLPAGAGQEGQWLPAAGPGEEAVRPRPAARARLVRGLSRAGRLSELLLRHAGPLLPLRRRGLHLPRRPRQRPDQRDHPAVRRRLRHRPAAPGRLRRLQRADAVSRHLVRQ